MSRRHYEIHMLTKEHRIMNLDEENNGDWWILATDREGWIPFKGKECPVPDNVEIECKLRSGKVYVYRGGSSVDWERAALYGDIVGYRPVGIADSDQTHKWDGKGLPPVGTICFSQHHGSKVRVNYISDQTCVLKLLASGREISGCTDSFEFFTEDQGDIISRLLDIARRNSESDLQMMANLYSAGVINTEALNLD